MDIAVVVHPVQQDGLDVYQPLAAQPGIKDQGIELAQIGRAVHFLRKSLPGGMQGSGICSAQLGFKHLG